jgi:hypothetical protein
MSTDQELAAGGTSRCLRTRQFVGPVLAAKEMGDAGVCDTGAILGIDAHSEFTSPREGTASVVPQRLSFPSGLRPEGWFFALLQRLIQERQLLLP